MNNQQLKYALFHLVQAKLKMHTFPPRLAHRTAELFNSIDPELFRNKKISSILPGVANAIVKQIQHDSKVIRDGLGQEDVPEVKASDLVSRVDPELLASVLPKDKNTRMHLTKDFKKADRRAAAGGRVIKPRVNRSVVSSPQATRQLVEDTDIKDMSHDELVREKADLQKQMLEINARLSLPDPTKKSSGPVDPNSLLSGDIHETIKDMLVSSTETENDRYMSSSFVIDEDRELTQFEKSDIKINSFLGVNDLSTLQMLFNPESLYVRYYVVLDSDYRIVEGDTMSRFKWNYTNSLNLQDGFANSTGSVRDVIGMRLYQPRIPYSAAMNTTAKRVSILIDEFAPQAFIGENGRRFHFLMRPNIPPGGPPTSIEISTEDYNDGLFHFRKPITTFDTLTVSFGDPLNLIEYTTPFDRFFIALEFTCYKSDK